MLKYFANTFFLIVLCAAPVSAQFDFSQSEPDGSRYIGGPRLGKCQNQTWRAGIIVEPGTSMDSIQLYVPVPANWKEQRIVNVNEEKMDAGVASQITYKNVNNGAMEMRIALKNIRLTKPLEIVVGFELQNYELLPPDNPDQYAIPKRLSQEIRPYLQKSPCIESDDPKFSKMFSEITKERRTDWDKIEALYSYVQNNVKYDDTAWQVPAKGALALIKMPSGEWSADCKDMCCLFVALCRAGKIPARIVRVPEHCYAEFYLELKQDKQPRSTGGMNGNVCRTTLRGTSSRGGLSKVPGSPFGSDRTSRRAATVSGRTNSSSTSQAKMQVILPV